MKRRLCGLYANLRRLIRCESGQDLIEYGLLAGFISVACIAAIQPVATRINGMLTNISSALAQVEHMDTLPTSKIVESVPTPPSHINA